MIVTHKKILILKKLNYLIIQKQMFLINLLWIKLEKILNNLEGVETAKVSLEEKKATIKYDETKINIENIKEAIEDAGFKGE